MTARQSHDCTEAMIIGSHAQRWRRLLVASVHIEMPTGRGQVIAKHANDNLPQVCDQLSLVQRVERALVLLAYLIEIEGDIHLPMYEQYEAWLAKLRSKNDVRARARQRLQAYATQGSTPAQLIAPTTSAA